MQQRRLWLKRPMGEWQSLLQTSHLCVVSGRMELLLSFLRARLSAAVAISLSSTVVLFQSTHPLRSISRKALPGHSVDVDSLHVSYADIVVSKVRAACGSSAKSQLTVENVFCIATILHTADMTQPSQSALSKQSVHTWKTSTRQYITVCYFVLPGCSQVK